MLKRHDAPYLVCGQAESEASEPHDGGESAPPRATGPHLATRTITRHGGLIGNIGGLDPGYNWRLFLNA